EMEIARLISVLRQREQEGEGSRYDRLRAEREAAELRIDITAARALAAAEGARITGYLPESAQIQEVRGEFSAPPVPQFDGLIGRALNARADYRAGQRNVARYQIEQQAARRLRVPEPTLSAGVKRGDLLPGVTATGAAFSLSVPLPVFNSGRHEVARYRAE